jgi:hypothetical protein
MTLGVPENWSGNYVEHKYFLPLSGIEPLLVGRTDHSLVSILTELSLLTEGTCVAEMYQLPHWSSVQEGGGCDY